MKVKKKDERLSRGRSRKDAIFPISLQASSLPDNYATTLLEIKQRIRQERLRTVLAANSAMTLLYWDVGRLILNRQKSAGWGAKVIDRLSEDLRKAYPDMQGLSPRNLKYMRAFAAAWPRKAIVQQLAAQIPWFQNCVLLDKLRVPDERIWHIRKVMDLGKVEQAPVDHIQRFLLELGSGFAFVGRQVPLEVGDEDFLVDLPLRNLAKPIGVAEWETRLVEELPEELKGSLPTVAEIEAELGR